jgi:hypothetical protein
VVAGVGAALLVASVVWALFSDTVSDGLRRDTTQQASYAMPAGGLTVIGGADDVTVVTGSAAGGVRVTRHLTWSPWTPAPTASERLNGSTLELDADCSGLFGWCDVDYVVTVPEASDLTVDSESGDVTVAGAFGSTVLKTGSGDIATTRLQATELTAYADSGDIALELGAVVAAVDVRAGSGDVAVRLPKDARYALSLDTGSGEQDVEVATDPSSASSMQVRTGSGDVELAYR